MNPKVLLPGEGRLLKVMTDNVCIKVEGSDTGGGYTIAELNDPPGAQVPLHIHDREDETFHVIEGLFEIDTGSERITAGPGTTVHLPRGLPHGFRTVGEGRNRALVVAAPAGIELMFAELADLPPGPPDPEKIGDICGRYGVRFV